MDSRIFNTWVHSDIDNSKDISVYKSLDSIMDQNVKDVFEIRSDGTFSRFVISARGNEISINKGEYKITGNTISFYFYNSYLDFNLQVLEFDTHIMKVSK